jgi:DNA repair exonuclease SbcCD nuclease subunit
MKIALLNDIHFGTRDDSPIFHNHIERFFETEFFPRLVSEKINTIICLGDLFDKRKTINFFTLERTKKYFFDRLVELNIKLIILVGNHDVLYKSSNAINSPQLLLKDYGNISVFINPTKIELGNKTFDLIPWINKSNYQETIDFVNSSSSMVCFSHLELEGFIFQQGTIAKDGMSATIFNRYHSVLTGHYHSKSSKGNIHYLGSQYDLTWADYGEKKYWHIFDTDTFELTEVENPIKMFVKLHYSDDDAEFEEDLKQADFSDLKDRVVKVIIKTRSNPVLFDLFLTKVNQSGPFDVSVVDENLYASDGSSDIDILVSDTHQIIKSSVEKIEVNIDKNKLLTFLNTLYEEASVTC